jgi:hypothetical protein
VYPTPAAGYDDGMKKSPRDDLNQPKQHSVGMRIFRRLAVLEARKLEAVAGGRWGDATGNNN